MSCKACNHYLIASTTKNFNPWIVFFIKGFLPPCSYYALMFNRENKSYYKYHIFNSKISS